jgi:TRAP-type transport system small permease protein
MNKLKFVNASNTEAFTVNSGFLASSISALDQKLMLAIRWTLIALLSAMAMIIFANVSMRYLTGASLVWAEEVARYLMIWLTFLGAGPVLRIGGHIAIENLQDALPRVLSQAVRCGVLICIIGLGLGMIVMGLAYMQRAQFQMTASTQIPFSYIYAAIPIGGVVLVWSALAIGAQYVSERRFEKDANDLHTEGVQV